MTLSWASLLVLMVSFLAAVGQLFFKLGAASVSSNLWSWFVNWRLIAGLFCDGLGFILLVIALKHGSLSILYPILAISYIWVALLSVRFLGEPFSAAQWIGIGLIVGGIGLIVRKV